MTNKVNYKNVTNDFKKLPLLVVLMILRLWKDCSN